MNQEQYWHAKHEKYLKKSWTKQPTFFVRQAIKYFPEKGKVLELATGQGQDAIFLAQKGYEVLATDISKRALITAKKKVNDTNLKIRFKRLDIGEDLPFKKASFDIVYCHMGLHYFSKEKTRKVLSEIGRVLKPGGILAIMSNPVTHPELKLKDFKKITKDYYQDPLGLKKRYFSVKSLKKYLHKDFEIILLDHKGRRRQDKTINFIRLIARKK